MSVRRARLWRSERERAADRLADQCTAAFAAGESEDDVLKRLGPPKAAGRRLRREIRRERGLAWKLWFYASRACVGVIAAFVVVYAVLFIRTARDEPTIGHNYWNDMNAEALAAAEADKAEPLYLEALRQLGAQPDRERAMKGLPLESATEAEADFARQFVNANQSVLQLVRAAAAKPVLGMVFSARVHRGWYAWRSDVPSDEVIGSPDNPLLANIPLPHLGELRAIARLLLADMSIAADQGDGARWLADARAILGIARHAARRGTLIQVLVGYGLGDQLLDRVFNTPGLEELLNDEELAELDRLLAEAAYQGEPGKFESDLSFENFIAADFIQRVYTDDGSGDGRFVMLPFAEIVSDLSSDDPGGYELSRAERLANRLIAPVASIWEVGRREMSENMRDRDAAFLVDRRTPFHLLSENSSLVAVSDRTLGARSWLERELGQRWGIIISKRVVLVLFWPAYGRVIQVERRFEQRHAAARVVVALVRFHQREKKWPAALDELVPIYLPSVPIDIFDGKSLKYRLSESGPILYSVGVGGIDNGGLAPANASDANDVGQPELRKAIIKPQLHECDDVFWPRRTYSNPSSTPE